jgi:glucosamine-6-phosphate deaminase
MEINLYDSKDAMGKAAARQGAALINASLGEKGQACIILATGASQFEMLGELVNAQVDWSRVTVFHLDEYIGIPETHPASFRKYLNERFVHPASPARFFPIDGEADPEEECRRLGEEIRKYDVDVAFVGIGENGHLAFNDPPADFETEEPYLVVDLDLQCRQQQLGEGWFPSLEAVPGQAISMSVRQILKSRTILCTVPDARKAKAVWQAVEGAVVPEVPASILQTHPHTLLYLDRDSSYMLRSKRS